MKQLKFGDPESIAYIKAKKYEKFKALDDGERNRERCPHCEQRIGFIHPDENDEGDIEELTYDYRFLKCKNCEEIFLNWNLID